MAEPIPSDMEDGTAEQITDENSLPLTTMNRPKKGAKTDNPYGDDTYCKGTLDVLKRLGAGKTYKGMK